MRCCRHLCLFAVMYACAICLIPVHAAAYEPEMPLIAFDIAGKWGFLDKKGVIVIPPQFDDAKKTFSMDGLGCAAKDDKWGIIDSTGAWVAEPVFDDIGSISVKGPLVAAKQHSKWGLIDKKGRWVVEARFEHVIHFADAVYSGVKENGRWGLIDASGKWVLGPSATFRRILHMGENGLAGAWDAATGKCGFINISGEWVIQPRFERVSWFNSQLAPAHEGGKAGYINPQGDWVVQPAFEKAYPFIFSGQALVHQKGMQGIIDTDGAWVVPPTIPMDAIFTSGSDTFYIMLGKDGARYISFTGEVVLEVDNTADPAVARDGNGQIVWRQQQPRGKDKAYVLFKAAAKKHPIGPLMVEPAAEASKAAQAMEDFAEAASFGSPEAMVVCFVLASKSRLWDKVYPALVPLEKEDYTQYRVRRGMLDQYGVWTPGLEAMEPNLMNLLYRLLCQCYVLGLGTPQDFGKAKIINSRLARDKEGYVIDEHLFDDPYSKEARLAFWLFTRGHPESAQFLKKPAAKP